MAVATLVASLVLTGCRVLTPSSRLLVMATALVPFALVGYALAAAAAGLVWWLSRAGRTRRVAAVVAVVSALGVVGHAGLLLPSYLGGHPSGGADLTVMTANLRLGQADAGAVTRIASDEDPDVVVLEEVTRGEMEALAALRASYPYVAGGAAPGAYGTVVLARHPLSDIEHLDVSKGAWLMRVSAPRPFWLVAVHTAQPLADYRSWGPDHATLLGAVRRLSGPVVMAGDFNATLDHRPMRRLLGAGLSDAARQANAGWQATWPVDERRGRLLPWGLGLMTLDHVLYSHDFAAVSTRTREVPYSDHRALIARLASS